MDNKDNILKDLYYDKGSTAYLSSTKTLQVVVYMAVPAQDA
jgi:hypothetical protein